MLWRLVRSRVQTMSVGCLPYSCSVEAVGYGAAYSPYTTDPSPHATRAGCTLLLPAGALQSNCAPRPNPPAPCVQGGAAHDCRGDDIRRDGDVSPRHGSRRRRHVPQPAPRRAAPRRAAPARLRWSDVTATARTAQGCCLPTQLTPFTASSGPTSFPSPSSRLAAPQPSSPPRGRQGCPGAGARVRHRGAPALSLPAGRRVQSVRGEGRDVSS